VADLKSWNDLGGNSMIQPGQSIKVSP
jgi:LysM repeat protein